MIRKFSSWTVIAALFIGILGPRAQAAPGAIVPVLISAVARIERLCKNGGERHALDATNENALIAFLWSSSEPVPPPGTRWDLWSAPEFGLQIDLCPQAVWSKECISIDPVVRSPAVRAINNELVFRNQIGERRLACAYGQMYEADHQGFDYLVFRLFEWDQFSEPDPVFGMDQAISISALRREGKWFTSDHLVRLQVTIRSP